MPPRPSLTSSFSVSDPSNEVICPLTNNDGSQCRKRCLGEKRYRSMQEHIRRAHPDHYIPKLPATEESFQRMVNTPPDQRNQHVPSTTAATTTTTTVPRSKTKKGNQSSFDPAQTIPASAAAAAAAGQAGIIDDQPALANAAEALAQLHRDHPHHHRPEWDQEPDSDMDMIRDRMRSSFELPPLRDQFSQEPIVSPFHSQAASPQQRDLMSSSSMIEDYSPPRAPFHAHSNSHPFVPSQHQHQLYPPPLPPLHMHSESLSQSQSHSQLRSPGSTPSHGLTLPALHRDLRDHHHHHHHHHHAHPRDDALRVSRTRKGSLNFAQSMRRPKHDRLRTREHSHTVSGQRPSLGFLERRVLSSDALSPVAAANAATSGIIAREPEREDPAWVQGKRWEDLIEAATSATEADEKSSERDAAERSSGGPPGDKEHAYTPVLRSPTSSLFYSSVVGSDSRPRTGLPLPHPGFAANNNHPETSTMRPVQPYGGSPLQWDQGANSAAGPVRAHSPPSASTDMDLEPFPSIETSLGPKHHDEPHGSNGHDPVSLPPSRGLLAQPQHQQQPPFKHAPAPSLGHLEPGIESGPTGPRGYSSMSVTSDPENFSLSNNNHNNASNPANNPFGGGTPTAPSRGSLFGGPSSASAHASANASPITLQRPVTAYSSYSGSPALRPTGAAIGARGLAERQGHGFRSLSGTGPHRASNPIPYTSASQQLPYPVNGSTQPTQPGLPGAFAGSANGPSLPHQQRLLSPPLRFAERQYTRERANTSSSLPPGAAATAAAASAGSLSRPSTSSATTIGPSNPAPPNLAMHRMNISTDQAGPANDEDEDRVMRDADVDMDAPEAPESGYQTQAQVQAHQPWMGPQIYCVACGRPSTVSDCLACPECICGACRECVSRIVGLASPTSTGEGSRRCPSCGTFEPRWKPFRLHFRREAA